MMAVDTNGDGKADTLIPVQPPQPQMMAVDTTGDGKADTLVPVGVQP
jgi:membrane-bound lytic murein transglycosylase B